MNKAYLKKLVDEATEIDPQNEVLLERNRQERLKEMAENLEDTISYLESCTEIELLWATEVLEDLSEIFKSKKLIQCVENGVKRCLDPQAKKQLNMTLDYMRKHV